MHLPVLAPAPAGARLLCPEPVRLGAGAATVDPPADLLKEGSMIYLRDLRPAPAGGAVAVRRSVPARSEVQS